MIRLKNPKQPELGVLGKYVGFFQGWTFRERLHFIKICFQQKCFCSVMEPDGAL